MPQLTETELAAAIEAGEIKALTLDTSIIDKYGRDFRHKVLQSLSQFKGTDVLVVFAEVVAREVQRHLAVEAEKTRDALNAAQVKYRKAWRLDEAGGDAEGRAALDADPEAFALEVWASYIALIGATVIPAADSLPIEKLMESYFQNKPPFEADGKKKAEFPDAIALLSLEEWASARSKKILVITADQGWHDFAAASDYVVSSDNLSSILGMFNRANDFLAQRIATLISDGHLPLLSEEVKRAIEEHFADSSLEVEADSSYRFDAEFMGVDVLSCAIVGRPNVIAADDESLDVAIEYKCNLRYNASLSWYVWDSVDKEEISMGSKMVSIEEAEEPFEIIVSFERQFEDKPDILQIEISQAPYIPDFGNVEPDWGD